MIQTGGFTFENRTICKMQDVPTIKGEFDNNGIANDISHEKGVLSMARANDFDSASSQFFICVADATYLDKNYAAFGIVLDEQSMNAAIEISNIETFYVNSMFANFPLIQISITTITREN